MVVSVLGPGGLSFCVPGTGTLSSLPFSYRIKERHLRWDEVRTNIARAVSGDTP